MAEMAVGDSQGEWAPPTAVPVIAQTNDAKDGITKCPSCGSSDFQFNPGTGMLHCNYCHREWSAPADTLNYDIRTLKGVHMGAAAQDIIPGTDELMTFKCSACGAEVVIDTAHALQARCHWCRHTLSINQQIPNGAVPDIILPFKITKEQARAHIEAFVGKRKFYAHPRFKAEFTTENIMGAYLPYMVVDVNAHAQFSGVGEHLVRRYTVGTGDDKETRYDADLYRVQRSCDLLIDDLTVESSSVRLSQNTAVNTNNIINTIMPFPLDGAVQFNAGYLKGYSSEKRDTNIAALAPIVDAQAADIARAQIRQTTQFYDRGLVWDYENVESGGQLWKSAYLPVWLYSYYQQKGNGQAFLHYVACNGVTGETMGSVPIHQPRLLLVSTIVEIVTIIILIFLLILLMA